MHRATKPVLICPKPYHCIVSVPESIAQEFQAKILHIFKFSDSAFDICDKKGKKILKNWN